MCKDIIHKAEWPCLLTALLGSIGYNQKLVLREHSSITILIRNRDTWLVLGWVFSLKTFSKSSEYRIDFVIIFILLKNCPIFYRFPVTISKMTADECRCDGRVVKALDSKSNGVSPRRFEPYSRRFSGCLSNFTDISHFEWKIFMKLIL